MYLKLSLLPKLVLLLLLESSNGVHVVFVFKIEHLFLKFMLMLNMLQLYLKLLLL